MTIQLRGGLLLAMILAAVGCATVRVDVDVYKGPLANHESVQTEQMAVMAVAAKPLLIELRERLELSRSFVYDNCGGLLKQKWYVDNRFSAIPYDTDPEKWLKDMRAQRVDAILTLYQDKGATEELRFVLDSLNDAITDLEVSSSEEEIKNAYDLIIFNLEDLVRVVQGNQEYLTNAELMESLADWADLIAPESTILPPGPGPTVSFLKRLPREQISNKNDPETIQKLKQNIGYLYRVLAAKKMLVKGRPDTGLENLIDDYIRITFDSSGDPIAQKQTAGIAQAAEEKLTRALVQFAEKVLVLANNDILLRDNNGTNANQIEYQKYTTVLQAIGNSILIQADEREFRLANETNLDRRGRSEAKALRNVLEGDPTFQGLIADSSAQDVEETSSERSLPQPTPAHDVVATNTPEPNAKEVLDLLIAALEFERIRIQAEVPQQGIPATPPPSLTQTSGANVEVKVEGTNNVATVDVSQPALGAERDVRVDRLTKALDLAYAYRSGMVYVRPSSAYLRSSYAATILQNDPGLSWRNRLGAMGLRNLPLVGGAWHNSVNGNDPEVARLRADIDRQFWQNINSVNVSGVGSTNYVIAKDDIGNWYVKNYSADPERIYQSAVNLAAFSFGGASGLAAVPKQAPPQTAEQIKDAPPDSTKVDPRNQVQKIFDKYAEDFAKATNEQIDALRKSLAGGDSSPLASKLEDGWKALDGLKDVNNGKPYDGDVDSLIEEYRKRLNEARKNSAEYIDQAHKALPDTPEKVKETKGAPITDALRAVRQYRNALAQAIADINVVNGWPSTKEQAQKTLDDKKAAYDLAVKANDAAQGSVDPDDDQPAATALATATRARDDVQNAYDRASAMAAAAQEASAIATSTVNTAVGTLLNSSVDARLATIKEFESAVGFVQETVAQ